MVWYGIDTCIPRRLHETILIVHACKAAVKISYEKNKNPLTRPETSSSLFKKH